MRFDTFEATIKGESPLIMHNGQLRDPMHPISKALSSAVKKAKGSKSDDDWKEAHFVEFRGGLYFDEEFGPCVPSDNLQALMIEGARKRKLGKQFEALVQVMEPLGGNLGYRLEYKGPRTPEALFANDDFRFLKAAVVGQAAVMRMRPRFKKWELAFRFMVVEGGPDEDQVREALDDAGLSVGLCDYTPRYGRFQLAELKKLGNLKAVS
jgi:hypothetical protein